jgi:hypothetical protein
MQAPDVVTAANKVILLAPNHNGAASVRMQAMVMLPSVSNMKKRATKLSTCNFTARLSATNCLFATNKLESLAHLIHKRTDTCILYAKKEAQRDATEPIPESAINPGLQVRDTKGKILAQVPFSHIAAPNESKERSLITLTRLCGHS